MERRQKVYDLALRGLSPQAIAEHLDLPLDVVFKDMRAILTYRPAIRSREHEAMSWGFTGGWLFGMVFGWLSGTLNTWDRVWVFLCFAVVTIGSHVYKWRRTL